MSSSTDTSPAPKKKGGFLKMMLLALVLLGAGGGGTYAAFASGMLGGGGDNEPAMPQLVLKGEEDPYAPTEEGNKDKKAAPTVFGKGGSKYRTAYFDFSEDFTSNLRDGTSLIQVSLAASTQRDGRVLMWLAEHETAIRSRILIEIAASDEADVTGPGGKERLQKRLAHAVNEVLTAQEGFGGVDNVYFRSFIVQ
jgi:flagellar FliL protein